MAGLMHNRRGLGFILPKCVSYLCKNLGCVYIHSACQDEHFCGEQRWGYVYWNTHYKKKSTIAPVVSISSEQMHLHLAHSPDFCKWATPMEITVKSNSDVIGEPVQFKLILQGVRTE